MLPERTSADSYVLSVSATDKDSGQNGRISYRLLSSPARGFFIDPDNGNFLQKIFAHKLQYYKTFELTR